MIIPVAFCLVICVMAMASWRDVAAGVLCPWNDPQLSLWSEAKTWPDRKIPGSKAEVTITNKVLLDIQPPTLRYIRVVPGGSLVWGNVDGITLNLTYLLVEGSFHMGSERCRFQKTATINLYGRTNTPYVIPSYGRKFIGVAPGGTLELHGQEKLSWTKLAHTIPASSRVACARLYDHEKSLLGQEKKQGLHVMIFNNDGSVYDFNAFNQLSFHTLPEFLSNLPPGLVVATAVRGSIGVTPNYLPGIFENLGATLIRSVRKNQEYAFLVRTGDTSTVRELVGKQDYIRLFDEVRGLEFRVASMLTQVDFQVVAGELTRPKISLLHDVSSWNVGDSVLVTSTDFDWRQAEVKHLVECDDCDNNQIRLDSPFTYMHYGEITMNVDERAEVALLTRNILIQGQLDKDCYEFSPEDGVMCNRFKRDMFGGHVKALIGSTIHVEGVELFQMGQQHLKAAYPLHLHMMNDGSGMWLRNNSIHHTNSRCITIHGTHNTEVSDNVCYMHTGHGYFLEDSVEQNTTLNRNLGVGTLHGQLLLSDRPQDWCSEKLKQFCEHLSTFWLTHPNNAVSNNVAAGSDGHGFFYGFARFPVGLSKDAPFLLDKVYNGSIQFFPLTFHDNVAHSNARSGMFFDGRISTGEYFNGNFVPENGIVPVSPDYDPRDPPNPNGTVVWPEMKECTFYKNVVHNMWIKAGNIRVTQSSLADAQRGLTGGTIGMGTGTGVHRCLFVGETNNTGEPGRFMDFALSFRPTKMFNRSFGRNPHESWTGLGFYQGPILVDTCHFVNYGNLWWADDWQQKYGLRPVRPGGAISFQRDNAYPSKPWSFVKNVTFDYCDDINNANWVFVGNTSTFGWADKDGNMALNFRDLDGSVTGHPNTQVVIDRPFYTGSDCVPRPNWQMTVCPYKYVQFEVVGKDGVLGSSTRTKQPLIVHRDDVPDDKIRLKGTQRNRFLARLHRSYTVNFNASLGSMPTFFDMRVMGLEKGDVIRVGLCLPKSTSQFEIRSTYPVINQQFHEVMATSLEELDADVTGRMFFWDSDNGMLFMKFVTNETRQTPTEECANGLCPRYKITRLDGDDVIPEHCIGNWPIADNTPPASPPQRKACLSPLPTGQGLGATLKNAAASSPFNLTCPTADPIPNRLEPEYRGCFLDKGSFPDMPALFMETSRSMTRQFCQDRCYFRGFLYSSLEMGKKCTCGDWFGLYGPQPNSECDVACTGDPSTTCGASFIREVYTTGLPVSRQPPARCGPNDMGIVLPGNTCLYLQLQLLRVSDAQRLCVRLGGNLAAIQSHEKQTSVEHYLREHHPDREHYVWTGLNHARNPDVWEQMDGTTHGDFFFWKGTNGKDKSRHFVYLTGQDGYMWMQTKDTSYGQPLCDLPLASPPLPDVCGEQNDGIRPTPKSACYKLMRDHRTQEQATYACHTAKGRLASFNSRKTRDVIARLLYAYGEETDYWLIRNKKVWVMEWKDGIYTYTRKPKTHLARTVCVLGWQLEGDSCYLDLGTTVRSYTEGAALCENEDGNSNLVAINSRSENNFVSTMVGRSAKVLLGLRYSPRFDEFVWRTGQQTAFSGWRNGHGKQNLTKGACAILRPTWNGGVWLNWRCSSLSARVVCEMPAF